MVRARNSTAPKTHVPQAFGTSMDAGGRVKKNNWCPGTESNRRHCDFPSHALPTKLPGLMRDRKSVVSGKSGSVRVDLGGRRILEKQSNKLYRYDQREHKSITHSK